MRPKKTMRAAFLESPRKIVVRETPVPEPGPGDVLVQVLCADVSRLDVQCFEDGRIGDALLTTPCVPGHECAGRVVKLGAGVRSLQEGDRVALEPGVPCRHCNHCRAGRYNLCPQIQFMGIPPVHGAFREYVTTPADFAYRLPEEVATDEGVMVEPLALSLHAINRADLRPGEKAAVLGLGPIGLLTVAAAHAAGPEEILAVDVIKRRLELADRMGATHTVNAKQEKPEEFLRPDRFGNWADVTIECAGAESAVRQSVDVAAPGGRVVWLGMGAPEASVPIVRALLKELTILSAFRYANVYPKAINLIATERVDSIPLITHRFEFPEVQDALEFVASHRETSVKTLLDFGRG